MRNRTNKVLLTLHIIPERRITMGIFTALKEFAYGLRLGANYSLSNRNGYVEKICKPGITSQDPGH